jgi:peptidyl-prolyl cis-trans isomerase D
MTMLDRMRRHKGWLKWSLALVVLTFVVFYIPGFLNGSSGQGMPGEAVAKVEGHPITVRDFTTQLNRRMQMFRGQGGNISDQMLKQLGIDRQVLTELIDEQAMLAEANRLGLTVNDAEVKAQILNFPAFQESGHFIGEDRYRALLRMQRPPMTPADFEEALRKDLLREKLQSAVTGWVAGSVTDTDVEDEYRRRNEKVKLEVVSFQADAFKAGVTATDDEIAQHFNANKDRYRIGEKRKVRYVLIDTQALRQTINPAPPEIEQMYQSNIQQYSNPEQVRASHILLKTEGKDEKGVEEVKKKAEDLLKQVKNGGDFAALAKQYSEDEGSKVMGGDLNFFGKGAMVPEFDAAVFTMQPGQISDLVKTQYGFHIIKLVEKRAPGVRPLADVRQEIIERLKWDRAQSRATELSTRVQSELKTPADFDRVAKANGLTVKESGLFLRDEPIADLGPSPQVASEAFTLKDGEVSEPLRTAQGFVFITVTGKQPSTVPVLDAVKERVRNDIIQKKAVEAAKAAASGVAPTLKSAANFGAAAKTAGREMKSTELISRGAVIPDAGASPAIDKVVFSLASGAVSDPIVTDTGAIIVKVVERSDVKPAELTTAKDGLKREMIAERQNRFFSSYMTKAKEKLRIETYPQTISRVLG